MNTEQARFNMIKNQIHTWGVVDDRVLDLFFKIPREKFVPDAYKSLAFADMAIPLGYSQTMMSPKEEARIIQALAVQPTDKILVLGTNSGYLAALLANLAQSVYSIDSIALFTEQAKRKFAELNVNNVSLITEDTALGWNKEAPYDVIVITGSLPTLPAHFQQGLAVSGRLFVILGHEPAMEATLMTRLAENKWQVEKLFETVRPRLADFKETEQFVF